MKILLVLLPFWSPLIPPLGIISLKSFLQAHGYPVKTVDANQENRFTQLYHDYFNRLKEYIPADRRGNFYNLGHDLLQNHMMAHLNYKDETAYRELVKRLIFNTFFCRVDNKGVLELTAIITEFHRRLRVYFLNLLEQEEPGVLGISVYSHTLPASVAAFKWTREAHPHIKTVMGGGVFANQLAVGSPDLDFFISRTPFIDRMIVGEGEKLFLKYLRGELPEGEKIAVLADTDSGPLDLSRAEIPDFSDLDVDGYPVLAAYTSRSCPFQCSFCAETVYWGKYRKKNTRQIAAELKKLHAIYNRQLFFLCDSLLNPVIHQLAAALTAGDVPVYWDGYLRVDASACDPGKVFAWRRGGFYRARIGVESGAPSVLAAMGKKVSPQQIKETMASLAHAGIKTTTYWVAGHPGETEDDFQQTLDLLEELKNEIYEAECNPFRYYLSGQGNSGAWAQHNKRPLYPPEAKEMLIAQTWVLDRGPTREQTFQRVLRFERHCRQLGIPNPYSLQEINRADERWKKLHKNAVPPMLAFKEQNTRIHEKKYVKKILRAANQPEDQGDFGF
jgi:hypothetical protein